MRFARCMALCVALAGCAGRASVAPVTRAAPEASRARKAPCKCEIDSVLDGLHAAAARADEAAYFEAFAPDGVFLGTDATERWTMQAFRAYAHPHFAAGKGWAYVPRERHVSFSPDGRVAWFDELLDNEKYGELRGSGVLVKQGKVWKVAQYNLTFTVPNEVSPEVVGVLRKEPPAP